MDALGFKVIQNNIGFEIPANASRVILSSMRHKDAGHGCGSVPKVLEMRGHRGIRMFLFNAYTFAIFHFIYLIRRIA
jgi:hypothetical protein